MAVDVGFQQETDMVSLIMHIDKIICQWEDDTGLTATVVRRSPSHPGPDNCSTWRTIGASEYFIGCYEQGESNG